MTVETAEEFHNDIRAAIQYLDAGKSVDAPSTVSSDSYEEVSGTLTPSVLDLIEAIRREEPTSINETARVVGRDVRNVHEELTRLGIGYFETNGRRKRPVGWFDELVVNLPFASEGGDTVSVPS